MKKAEYMKDHIGETFDAVVSSVMKFGLFVELPNTVEGLIHISAMNDDYYEYVEKQMALVGRSNHHIFRIGQPVKVKLLRVDKDQREVDFEMVNPEEAPVTKLRVGRDNGRHGHGRHNQKHGHGRRHGSYGNRENGHRNNRQINRGQTRHGGDKRGHARKRH